MPEATLSQGLLIRNISDTARWVAMHRAIETERPDALFRDRFARKLAGERGEEIVRQFPRTGEWSWALRTHLFDQAILAAVRHECDTVVNLAAGFDARPFRLKLPQTLRWIEVDLPELLREKERMLRSEKPVCLLERVALDLADAQARRELFARVGSTTRKALIVSEGLLIYLEREDVLALGQDLAAVPAFRRWVLDIASPGLLRMVQKSWGERLAQGGSPPKFAPAEGAAFFEAAGWRVAEVHSVFQAAAKAKRLPFLLSLMAFLPESSGKQGGRPWSGVCVLERAPAS